MTSTMPSRLILTPQVITGMFRASLEPRNPVESFGRIYGNKGEFYLVTEVYNYTQTKRTLSMVRAIPNFSLPKLLSLEEALRKFDPKERLGDYHSHICSGRFSRDRDNLLSITDLKDIEDSLKEQDDKEWIELLIRLRERKPYTGKRKPGVTFTQRNNMLSFNLCTNSNQSLLFSGAFIGYAVSLRDDYDELKERYSQDKDIKKRLNVREVRVELQK